MSGGDSVKVGVTKVKLTAKGVAYMRGDGHMDDVTDKTTGTVTKPLLGGSIGVTFDGIARPNDSDGEPWLMLLSEVEVVTDANA
jgi:hypothetical protein